MSTGYPWFKCRREPWHTLISKAEKPLPKIVAPQDLEALESGKIPPTQTDLCQRWGWSRGRVRWLLEELRGAKKPTTSQQPKSNQTTTTQQPNNNQTTTTGERLNLDNSDDHNQPTTTQQPANNQTTTKQQPANNHATIHREEDKIRRDNKSNNKKADFDRAVAFWKGHRPKGPKLIRSKGGGKLIAARIKDHGIESVIDVLGWALTSDHTQARWLRDHGYCRLVTLCGAAKFEGYLETAQNATPAKQRGEWTDYDDEPNKTPF